MQIGRLVALIEADTTQFNAALSGAISAVEGFEGTMSRAAGAGGAEFAGTGAAVSTVGAAAMQSATGIAKWSSALSTAASVASIASGTATAAGAAIRGLRAVNAAGGLAKFAASLNLSNRGLKSFIPSGRTAAKLLGAVGAAGGLYLALKGIKGAAGTAKRALGGVINQVVLLKGLRSGIGSLFSGMFGPLGLAIGGVAGGLAGLAGIGAAAAWGARA